MKAGAIHGLRVSEAIVIFFLLFGGANIASGRAEFDYFRPWVGWLLLAVSAVALILEIERWVKILPAIFGYGILQALRELQTGHVLGMPNVPVSRRYCLALVAIYAAIAVVSATIAPRKLNRPDRVALMVFAGLCTWAFAFRSDLDMVIRFSSALGCLLIAWVYDRLQRRRTPTLGHHVRGPAGSPADPARRRGAT